MRERPIIFAAPMVLALLDDRKGVTRRIIKPGPRQSWLTAELLNQSPKSFPTSIGGDQWAQFEHPMGGPLTCIKSPFAPGDCLWVKETWRPSHVYADGSINIHYAADGIDRQVQRVPDGWTMPKAAATGNVSPLFMPRWASRVTRKVVSVRPERLHDITEEDAVREGIWPPQFDGDADSRHHFLSLWDTINGPGSATKNPWVWRVEFEVEQL